MSGNALVDLASASDLTKEPDGAAVIVAAGSGQRMGFDKTLITIADEPLIRHTVRAFDLCADIREIVIVTAADRETRTMEVLQGFTKQIRVVRGGKSRQESVLAGLNAVTNACPWVAIHDGARPLISTDLISRCFAAAREFGGSVAAERLTDTLQRASNDQFCGELVPREDLWRMQTPQVFQRESVRQACQTAADAGIILTDETSAMRRAGHRVFLVENTDWNIKVTLSKDVPVVDFLLRSRPTEPLS